MRRSEYYKDLKTLACEVRAKYGLDTPRVLRSDLRKIYRDNKIAFDLWPLPGYSSRVRLKKLRGAFFYDEDGSTIMINCSLPNDPAVFAMGHELKHFLVDRNLQRIVCSEDNIDQEIEIGAEVFSAELIYPDQLFIDHMTHMAVDPGKCTAEILVKLKRLTQTTLSYEGLKKKAEFLGFAIPNSMNGTSWKKLEVELYGEPAYKQFRKPLQNEAS
jgi:IrrE N-terminal-like domain